jgi:type 1 glutamine amidotransferase
MKFRAAGATLVLLATLPGIAPVHACASQDASPLRVLAFSRTEGFRHDSIDTGHATLEALALRHGFSVERSEDASRFTPSILADVDVVVFLNTTGDVLDDAQQTALQAFVEQGGGWVGVHSAADTEYDWPFYGAMLGNGAWFRSHPEIQSATLLRDAATHPATALFGASAAFTDEWYNFRASPAPAVQVLMRLDEASYEPGTDAMGDHPIVWSHAIGEGRAFYTGLGHRRESYALPAFRHQLAGAIFWTACRPFERLFFDGFDD